MGRGPGIPGTHIIRTYIHQEPPWVVIKFFWPSFMFSNKVSCHDVISKRTDHIVCHSSNEDSSPFRMKWLKQKYVICICMWRVHLRLCRSIQESCCEAGPRLNIRKDVFPQDLVKSRSHVIGTLNCRIALKFDRHISSTAAEVPVKFQSDRTILNSNLAASRLYEILRKDVFSDIETWQLNGVAIAQNWPQSHQAASEIDTFNTIAYLINVQITKFYFSSMVKIDRTEFVHSKYEGTCYRRYLLST